VNFVPTPVTSVLPDVSGNCSGRRTAEFHEWFGERHFAPSLMNRSAVVRLFWFGAADGIHDGLAVGSQSTEHGVSATVEIVKAGVINRIDEPLTGQVIGVTGMGHGNGALDVWPAGGEFTGDRKRPEALL
jgi:hypothetical protein